MPYQSDYVMRLIEQLSGLGLTAVAEMRRDQAIAVRSLLESKATKPSPE